MRVRWFAAGFASCAVLAWASNSARVPAPIEFSRVTAPCIATGAASAAGGSASGPSRRRHRWRHKCTHCHGAMSWSRCSAQRPRRHKANYAYFTDFSGDTADGCKAAAGAR